MTASARAIALTRAAAAAARDKLGADIVAFDVSEQLFITDVFLICSARNQPQLRAIQDAIEEALQLADAKPARREGTREGHWVLLDYFDLVIHLQLEEERKFYALERLWSDCPLVDLA